MHPHVRWRLSHWLCKGEGPAWAWAAAIWQRSRARRTSVCSCPLPGRWRLARHGPPGGAAVATCAAATPCHPLCLHASTLYACRHLCGDCCLPDLWKLPGHLVRLVQQCTLPALQESGHRGCSCMELLHSTSVAAIGEDCLQGGSKHAYSSRMASIHRVIPSQHPQLRCLKACADVFPVCTQSSGMLQNVVMSRSCHHRTKCIHTSDGASPIGSAKERGLPGHGRPQYGKGAGLGGPASAHVHCQAGGAWPVTGLRAAPPWQPAQQPRHVIPCASMPLHCMHAAICVVIAACLTCGSCLAI